MTALHDYWAKSPLPGEARGESLADHTRRVLEELAQLLRLHPAIASLGGEVKLGEAAYWAVLFHDLGKIAPGFQAQVRGGGRWGERHEVLSLGFIPWAIPPEDPMWLHVASAVAFHHHGCDEVLDRYLGDDSHWGRLTSGLESVDLRAVFEWFSTVSREWAGELGLTLSGRPLAFRPDRADSLVVAARAALERIDQLRSEMPPTLGVLLRGLVVASDHAGSAGADPAAELEPSVADRLGAYGRVHQERAARIRGSVLITAPTGSGKTEASLRWALAQRPSRLYYVLPYQASLNAMYRRLEKLFPSGVALQHSRSLMVLYRHYMESESTPRDAERRARMARELTRLNRFPVRVVTPYQLLQLAFRLKGFESLVVDLFQAAVVMDEVHAYEPRRIGMFLALLRWLQRHCKASVGFVSATMPPRLREAIGRLFEGIAMVDRPVDQAYRRLFEEFRRHEPQILPGEITDWLEQVRDFAQSGSVLVVVNTVGRAQEVYRELRSAKLDVLLLHSRFTLRDRIAKERPFTGSGGTTVAPQGCVLVATQVVEVSLDIDFDTIFTEPAPLEALVQRFGRVNRSRRHRLAPVHVVDTPRDGQGVYDPELVTRGLQVLRGACGSPVDEATVSEMLGEVYTGAALSRWQGEFEAGRRALEGILQGMRPFETAPPGLEEEFYRLFDGVEVLPAALEGEYRQAVATEPLKAAELLVPLTYDQYRRLSREGKVRSVRWPPVVDAPYDPELGLLLSQQLQDLPTRALKNPQG